MSEANPCSFRTAVGGFHKGDVSAYITKTAAEHQAQLSALQQQLEALQSENALLKDRLQLAERALAARPAEEPPKPEPAPSLEARELQAYRRAASAERLALSRAGKLYQDMQAICDESSRYMQEADQATRTAAQSIERQLDTMRQSLKAAQDSVRTSAESLKTMSYLLPDPAEGLEEV